MRRWLAMAVILAGTATSAESCASAAPAEPESCANGEGHWIEDESSWLDKTQITVRLCLSENGQVLDLEVD